MQIQRPSSFISFFKPIHIVKTYPGILWEAVRGIFQKKSEPLPEVPLRKPVALVRGCVDDEKEPMVLVEDGRFSDLSELFDRSSNPYPIQKITMGDVDLEIAKTFLTDIERIGEPDQFFIDGEEIAPAPRTEDQKIKLIAKLLQIAEGNAGKVKRWTEIWNYRIKVHLLNAVMEDFSSKYRLYPVFSRNGFERVIISLDTKKNLLKCEVEGNIHHATDENQDIVKKRVHYHAMIVFDESGEWIEQKVIFNSPKPALGGE